MPSPSWSAALAPIIAVKRAIRERTKSRDARATVGERRVAADGRPPREPATVAQVPASPQRFTRRDQMPTRTQKYRQEQFRAGSGTGSGSQEAAKKFHSNQAWPSPDTLLDWMEKTGDSGGPGSRRARTRSESHTVAPEGGQSWGWCNGAR